MARKEPKEEGGGGAKAHPLLDAADVGEQEAREFFREVSLLVRYASYSEYPWERFKATKRLAMLDLWSDKGEKEKSEAAGIGEADLSSVRSGELYACLKFDLTEAFRDVAAPKSAEEWVRRMEDAAFRRLSHIARMALDPKVAAAAARDFADRAAPKVSRNRDEDGKTPVLMITEDGAKLLLAAMETVRRKTEPLALPPGESE